MIDVNVGLEAVQSYVKPQMLFHLISSLLSSSLVNNILQPSAHRSALEGLLLPVWIGLHFPMSLHRQHALHYMF